MSSVWGPNCVPGKAKGSENIAFEDYVRWQVWTVGPLSSQVKVYRVPLKVKIKCSWEVVDIVTEKGSLAKCFVMTTKYLLVILWKQYC